MRAYKKIKEITQWVDPKCKIHRKNAYFSKFRAPLILHCFFPPSAAQSKKTCAWEFEIRVLGTPRPHFEVQGAEIFGTGMCHRVLPRVVCVLWCCHYLWRVPCMVCRMTCLVKCFLRCVFERQRCEVPTITVQKKNAFGGGNASL